MESFHYCYWSPEQNINLFMVHDEHIVRTVSTPATKKEISRYFDNKIWLKTNTCRVRQQNAWSYRRQTEPRKNTSKFYVGIEDYKI